MKTKDLIYIGIIGYLGYLLLKKKPNLKLGTSTTPPAGNQTNGGLNLGSNMDLPNLTPTPPDGLTTEDALNNSNVTPLVKDENEPTQIFGGVNLPTPILGTSVVIPNPVDSLPIRETPIEATPIDVVPTKQAPIIYDPIKGIKPVEVILPIENTPIYPAETNPVSVYAGESVVSEPVFPIKTVSAQLITQQPAIPEAVKLSEYEKDEMISTCGNSFSIPNYDREGSYTNFWVDGDLYYTQTISPLIRTIPTKISKEAFLEGCKKFQLVTLKNSIN